MNLIAPESLSAVQTESPVIALGFHFRFVVIAGSSSSASPFTCSPQMSLEFGSTQNHYTALHTNSLHSNIFQNIF